MFQELSRTEHEATPRQAGPDLWQRLEVRLPAGDGGGTLWSHLEDRLSAPPAAPCLRPGVLLKPAPCSTGPAYLLGDVAAGRYFSLGEREAAILALLDGRRSWSAVVDECSRQLGLDAPAVERFLYDLRYAGLLQEPSSLWQRLGGLAPQGPLILWSLDHAEEKLAVLARRLRFLFHPVTWVILAGLALAVPATLLARLHFIAGDLAALGSSWWSLLLLLLLYPAMLPVVLTHELAHALLCTHLGGRVSRLGLMVQRLLPAAFADVSDIWSLPRTARVAVFMAGPASMAFWLALFAALWAWAPLPAALHLFTFLLLLSGLFSLAGALSPVAGYDGSEVLAEWLQLPDLHRRALTYWRRRLRRAATANSRREERVFQWYGGAFLLYNIVMAGLLLFILSHIIF